MRESSVQKAVELHISAPIASSFGIAEDVREAWAHCCAHEGRDYMRKGFWHFSSITSTTHQRLLVSSIKRVLFEKFTKQGVLRLDLSLGRVASLAS